jgi:hypothetical protein
MIWTEPDTICAGCDRDLPGTEVGHVWILGALGLVVERTHRLKDCAEAAVARHPEQPARRVRQPRSAEDRMREEVERPPTRRA